MIDLFIAAGEASGDLHGAKLIRELLIQRPELKIGAVAGPQMRKTQITPFFEMEKLQVMGFVDVLFALPKIARQFFAIRKKILQLNPQALLFIDYPGFHLRLERSLRKKGYKGKIIHFICPSVWAWGKKRIDIMEKNLDLLLTIFPFESTCFQHTNLPVQYIGHPLTESITPTKKCTNQKILSLFPGSRQKEIDRNLPLQLKIAQALQQLDPTLTIAISSTPTAKLPPISNAQIIPPENNYELMSTSHLAIATSGTVTLELALHNTPTIVTYAIKPLDCFIAQKILRINLPFYCIVNIIMSKSIFPELFGPNLTEENLFFWAKKLWLDNEARNQCIEGCKELQEALGNRRAATEAAHAIICAL